LSECFSDASASLLWFRDVTGPILLVALAVLVGWGSAHFASRDPPSASWMKIAFACVLLLGLLAALAGSRWIVGEEDLSGITLIVWPMAIMGIVACVASVLGRLVGIYRRKNSF